MLIEYRESESGGRKKASETRNGTKREIVSVVGSCRSYVFEVDTILITTTVHKSIRTGDNIFSV